MRKGWVKMPSNYTVNNIKIENLLSWIDEGRIGLPEMQRPFVWTPLKVSNLIDSLYKGYPIGYIITWQNPAANLKNGGQSGNKQIIIDGQQRLTALRAALSGEKIVTKKYQTSRIKIAFNPSTESFATLNSAIEKDPLWIDDISIFFKPGYNGWTYVNENNERLGMDPNDLGNAIHKLQAISEREIGNIELSSKLTISSVTNIFNRINATGVSLSSADLVMSRLSADEKYGGNILRKQIEYFVQLMSDPTLLKNIEKLDSGFSSSKYFSQIKWIVNEVAPIYQPNYSDILHVLMAVAFGRGKLSDLISLISGRDFATRSNNEDNMKQNYEKLFEASALVLNKSNFQRYLMILRDMGMRNSGKLGLTGHGALNFGYILFLYLNYKLKISLPTEDRNSLLKKWIVMASLTGRYSGSSETIVERDLKLIMQNDDPIQTIQTIRQQTLSDLFWKNELPNRFDRQSTQASSWRIFQMCQIYFKDIAWLSKDTSAETVMEEQGNIHHIFPRAYLRKHKLPDSEINSIANYVWITQPKNLEISDLAPREYLHDNEITKYMSQKNDEQNAIPTELRNYDYHDYQTFLHQRRGLMSQMLKQYYEDL